MRDDDASADDPVRPDDGSRDRCDFDAGTAHDPVFGDTRSDPPAGGRASPATGGRASPPAGGRAVPGEVDFPGLDPDGPKTVKEAWAAYRALVERGPEPVGGKDPHPSTPSSGPARDEDSGTTAHPPRRMGVSERQRAYLKQVAAEKRERAAREAAERAAREAEAAQRREKMAEVRRKGEARKALNPRPLAEQRLTHCQEAFCQDYIAGHSGTEAARNAGYAADSAHVSASRLLRLPKIARRIAVLRRDRGVANDLSPEVVLAKLERLYIEAARAGSYTAAARILTLQAQYAGLMAKDGQAAKAGAHALPDDGDAAKADAKAPAKPDAKGDAKGDAKPGAKEEAKGDAKDADRRAAAADDADHGQSPGATPPPAGGAADMQAAKARDSGQLQAPDDDPLRESARPVPRNLWWHYESKRQRAAQKKRGARGKRGRR